MAVLSLIQHFINLCLLKSRPEHTPYSVPLFLLAIISYMVVAFAAFSLISNPNKTSVIVAIDIIMLLASAYAGLWVCSLLNRALKVVTALAGTGTVMYIVGYPVFSILHLYHNNTVVSTLIFSVWAIWKVGVTAHIARYGMDLPWWLALGVAVLYVYTYLRVVAATIVGMT